MRNLKLFFLVSVMLIGISNAWSANYKKTSLEDVKSTDVVIVVGYSSNSSYALSNDKGTSAAPTAVSVTVNNETITTDETNILWNISENNGSYTIRPNGDTSKALYCTDTNNGVRVGTNSNNIFIVEEGYFRHSATNRYVGIYNGQDWRCYTSISNGSNIANQSFEFYVLQTYSDVDAIITLNIAGTPTSVEGYKVDQPFSLPELTSVDITCGDKEFVGWSTIQINNSLNEPSTFYKPGTEITLEKENTFYAVFAEVATETTVINGTVTEDFEAQEAGNTYNSTQNYTVNNSNAGIAWTMYYGIVSTNAKINGSNSAQMRFYCNKQEEKGYIQTTSAITGLQKISFDAIVSNNAIKLTVQYSTDQEIWNDLVNNAALSTSNKNYEYSINGDASTEYYIKIAIGSSTSSTATTGNYTFRVDDVKFTYKTESITTTYSNYTTSCSSGECEDKVTLKVSAGEGGQVSWNGTDYSTTLEDKVLNTCNTTNTTYLYVQPDENYTIDKITDNGSEIDLQPTATGSNIYLLSYEQNATGEHKIVVTFKEKAKYTLTYYINTEANTIPDVYEGTNILSLLPETAEPCDPTSTTFMGWTTQELTEKQPDTPPTIGPDDVIESSNITLYALFAKEKGDDNWNLCSTVESVTEGTYVITWNDTYYLPSETASTQNPNAGTDITTNQGRLTNAVTSDMQWSFTGDNNSGWIVSHKSGTNTYYLDSENKSQGISINEESKNTTWIVSIDPSKGMLLTGSDEGSRYLSVYEDNDKKNYTWRYYLITGNDYKGTLRLYKQGITYTDFITTCKCPEAAPENLQVSELTAFSAKLTWDPVAYATRYRIVVIGDDDIDIDEYTTETFYLLSDLNPETDYIWTVAAVAESSSCEELESTTNEFTTPEHECIQLPPPTNLKVVREEDWKYTFSWDAVENATEYLMSGAFSGTIERTYSTRNINVLPGNSYTVYVTAKGDGKYYCDSDPAGYTFTADEYFTLTLNPGNGTCEGTSMKGGVINELPEAQTQCDGYQFAGWSKTELTNETSIAPQDLYTAGSSLALQENITLYAVYVKTEEGTDLEDKTITLTATDFGLTSSYNVKTATIDGYSFTVDKGFLGTNPNAGTIQMNSSQGAGVLYNTTAIPNLQSITLKFNTDASKDVTVYEGNSDNPNTTVAGTTRNTQTIDITSGNEYFSIKVGGVTYFTNVIVNYQAEVPAILTSYTTYPDCRQCEESGAEFAQDKVRFKNATGEFDSPRVIYNAGKENLSPRTYSSTNTKVATVNSDGRVTVHALGSTYITFTQPRYVTDTDYDICAVEISYLLQVGPDIDIVEWQEDGVILHVDKDDNVNPQLIVSGEQESGDIETEATDIFFSKYFEAEGNTKLLAIYNGTKEPISLTDITIWHGDNQKINLSSMMATSDYYKDRSDVIYPREELIFYNKGEYSDCAEGQEGFEKWIDCDNAAALNFSGRITISLKRGEEVIDVIGAYNDKGPVSIPKDSNIKPSFGDSQGFVCTDGTNYLTGEDGYELSTNRCLLIRKNSVTDGTNAVQQNSNGEFATLCQEWQGLQIKTVGAKGEATCEGFAGVGGFDYSDYYKELVQIAGSDLSGYIYNEDEDLYKFPVTVSDYACLNMEFRLVNPDDEKDIWAQETVKVPILVSGQASTTDALFTNIVDGHPDLSIERCSECDVVVLEGASLTLTNSAENNVTELRGIKVYPDGELIVEQGASHRLRNIAFRRKDGQVASAQLNGNPTLTGKLPYSLDLYVSAQKWHFITLPYDCQVEDVTYADGTKAKFGTEWFAMYYDGAKRVENKAQQTCWTEITDFTLKAGVGYIVGILGYDNQQARQELRFPMADLTSEERQDKFVPIKAYGAGKDITPNHKGWNLVGNPYLYNYRESDPGEFSGLAVGKLIQSDNNTRDWVLDGPEIPYIARPLNNGDAGYEQLAVAGYDLPPFTCYFVQAGNDQHSDNDDLGIEFKATNKVEAAATSVVRRAPEEYTDTYSPVLVTVSLANSQAETDRTSLVVSDRFLPSYEMGADLVKWFGDNYRAYSRPVLWSLASDGQRAFNALSEEAALQTVPLGIYAAAQGDYTFSLVRTEALGRVADVWLHDALTGTYTNLMEQDYTFNTAPADGTGRFSLSVRLVPQTATAVDNALAGCTITSGQGTLTVNNLPPHASLWLYDTSGRLLHAESVNHVQRTYEVPQAGVYYVRIESANNEQILRTIVK